MAEIGTTHSEAEEAELRKHYETLLPEATADYVNYFLAHTPAQWQDDMKDLIQEGLTEEIPAMIRNNLGAPPSQIVDVDAAAQAAAKSVGTREANEIRDRGLEVGSPNPVNSRFPLVNIKPTPTGPEITGGDPTGEAKAASAAELKDQAYQRNRDLNQQGNEGTYDASTSTLRPHPEQYSDTPAVAPSVLPDSYEPPRQ